MAISLSVGGYLLYAKPMVSPFANRLELINELTIVVLTYGQLHFTDYIPEP